MPAIPPTNVMTIGGLGIGAVSPSWRFNFLNPARTTPQEPQNLLVQTIQGAGVGGLGATMNADGSMTLTKSEQGTIGISMLVVAALVGGVSAVHGYRRNKGSKGWGTVWGIAGAVFPAPALSVALIQGFAKPAR